jgi:hypothetical protein
MKRLTKVNPREIIEMVRSHAQGLDDDVNLTATRMEHIRVTARANEAHQILNLLTELWGETSGEATDTA